MISFILLENKNGNVLMGGYKKSKQNFAEI